MIPYFEFSDGACSGYQQSLFGKLYFDGSVSFLGVSFEKRLFRVRESEFMAKAGIGFAL